MLQHWKQVENTYSGEALASPFCIYIWQDVNTSSDYFRRGEKMFWQKEYNPQFRESDPSGYVGARGYLNYFQDVVTGFLHDIHKGNDIIPISYGRAWLFTKYKIKLYHDCNYDKPLHFTTWEEPPRRDMLLYQDFVIHREGEKYAEGRLEACLFHLGAAGLCRFCDIEYPTDIFEDRKVEVSGFERMKMPVEDMEYCYTHTVKYTDLDNNMHMNNLIYINLFLNAFKPHYFMDNPIHEFEIHYLGQSFYDDEIDVYKKHADGKVFMTGIKKNGGIVARCIIA